MVRQAESIVERVATQAVRLGAEVVEVEYKDGYEEVFAAKGGLGYGIARLRSSSPEALTLRQELHRLAKRKRRIVVDGYEYELRCRVYDSFGEEALAAEVADPVRVAVEERLDADLVKDRVPCTRGIVRAGDAAASGGHHVLSLARPGGRH